MRFVTAFRSGNCLRITLPRTVRRAIKLRAGDTVSLDNVREGVIELKNITTERDRKVAGRKW